MQESCPWSLAVWYFQEKKRQPFRCGFQKLEEDRLQSPDNGGIARKPAKQAKNVTNIYFQLKNNFVGTKTNWVFATDTREYKWKTNLYTKEVTLRNELSARENNCVLRAELQVCWKDVIYHHQAGLLTTIEWRRSCRYLSRLSKASLWLWNKLNDKYSLFLLRILVKQTQRTKPNMWFLKQID